MDWFWECALFQLLRLFGWLYSTFQTEARTVERLTLISSKIILSLFDNVRKGHFLVHKVKPSFNQTKTDVSHCQTNNC